MSFDDPGIGMLIGMQFGSARNNADFAAETKRLRDALTAASIEELAQMAQKEAAKDCVGAIVKELTLKEAGRPYERRHSDPDAKAARAEDFIDTAEAHLNRISSGRLTFSDDSVQRIKNSRADVKEIVKAGGCLEPKAILKASPIRPR
ncbi:MAG: hypothetical protein Q7U28_09310 [Aquabacterium sp.]|nr:hypothetical protein [Aquabacterium sp.]